MKRALRSSYTMMAALPALCLSMISSAQNFPQDHHDDEPVVTHHAIKAHGRELSYTARAGYISITDEEHVVHGRIFYAAYVLDQPAGAPARPLVFAWNGGPGSNASLQELGALGPRRAQKTSSGMELVDNEDTWLQFADIVFVDPVNTGYSYATSPEHLKEFINDQGDADSIAEFIRLYQRRFNVQRSPLFIEGESYGTFRAAGVAEILAARKIPLSGVIMLSTILNIGGSSSELESVFLLPNYAATAFVHHRLAPELEKNLDQTTNEVQHWAESEYLAVLVAGDRLSPDKKKAIAQRLARYTGIPADTWEANNLALGPDEFAQNVLGDKPEYVGHYDTRDTGKLSHKGEPYNVAADPSLNYGVEGIVTDYLQDELGWKSDAFYAGPFGGRWPSANSFRGDWASVRWGRETGERSRAEALATALRRTPGLRVLIGSGYYDFSTPYAAAEYSISHLDLGPKLRGQIEFKNYAGGHAAYMDPTVRVQFAQDVQKFITGQVSTEKK